MLPEVVLSNKPLFVSELLQVIARTLKGLQAPPAQVIPAAVP
jgi:hypothetical protein